MTELWKICVLGTDWKMNIKTAAPKTAVDFYHEKELLANGFPGFVLPDQRWLCRQKNG